jgi:choloylglycine hydrolase
LRRGGALPQTAEPKRAVAQIFSLIRGVSVPLGFTTPDKPNVASTIWRTAYDQKDRVMYFDSATSPNVFWLPLDTLAFDAGAPVRRLPLKGNQTYSGDATAGLEAAEPFVFLPAKPH